MKFTKYLYHMDNHIDQVGYVEFEGKVSRLNSKSKNIYKKNNFNWALC